MLSSHLLLALAWIGYFVIHSLMAHMPVKNWFREKMGPSFKFYRLFYSISAIGLLLPVLYWQITISSPRLWSHDPLTWVPAALLTVAGLWGAVICLKKYLVSPQGFSDLFFEGMKPELHVSGLHRIVRHPLYLSTFIFLGGVILFFPFVSNLLAYLLLIVYVLLAIPLEENKLVELYGKPYESYREDVPALIPKLFNKRRRKAGGGRRENRGGRREDRE
jgi:protein-S-isoprenylcysteine O-methyltransferase Ste14